MIDLAQAQDRARGIVRRILRQHLDAVDDCLQEAALLALRRDQFRGESQFSTYFTRIAMNAALMYLRKNRHAMVPEDVLVHVPAPDISPEQVSAANERAAILWEEIAQLTPKRREAAYRALREERVGSTSAHKAAHHLMRHKLRDALQERGVR